MRAADAARTETEEKLAFRNVCVWAEEDIRRISVMSEAKA